MSEKVLVVGLSVTGSACAQYLSKSYDVYLTDSKKESEQDKELLDKLRIDFTPLLIIIRYKIVFKNKKAENYKIYIFFMIKTNLQKSIYNYRKNKKKIKIIYGIKKTSSNLSNYPLLYQQQK